MSVKSELLRPHFRSLSLRGSAAEFSRCPLKNHQNRQRSSRWTSVATRTSERVIYPFNSFGRPVEITVLPVDLGRSDDELAMNTGTHLADIELLYPDHFDVFFFLLQSFQERLGQHQIVPATVEDREWREPVVEPSV